MGDEVMQLHPQLGWVPAIPEPYWVRKWPWSQYKPKCFMCGTTFSTRLEWETHYALTHLAAEPSQPEGTRTINPDDYDGNGQEIEPEGMERSK